MRAVKEEEAIRKVGSQKEEKAKARETVWEVVKLDVAVNTGTYVHIDGKDAE